MRLSVIITTHNSANVLARVLEGYKAQTVLPDEFVIAEDGEDPATAALVSQIQEIMGIRFLHVQQPHEGFRRSRILNLAIASTQSDYIVITDGDCVPERRFISDHKRLAEVGCWVQGCRAHLSEKATPTITLKDIQRGGLWLTATHKLERFYHGIRWLVPIVKKSPTHRMRSLGSNMAFWRTDLFDVNGFNEDLFGWGYEDREIALRLFNSGRRQKRVIGRALQYHLYHPPTSRDRRDANHEIMKQQISQQAKRCVHGLSGINTKSS